MGATILLVGLVATLFTAPLFDRVLTHHLALSCKVLCPVVAAAWLSLIWAGTLQRCVVFATGSHLEKTNTVRRNDTSGLFVIMAIIGAASLTLLPVALELAVELTRNANASSAMLWASSNLIGVIFVLGVCFFLRAVTFF